MLHVTWLIILLPLVGFAIQVLFGKRLGDPVAGWVATAFIGASFVVSIGVYLDLLTVHAPVRSFTQDLWTWIPVDQLQVHANLFVDPLSMTMVLFVTGVSMLIHLYSIGYMKGDPDYPKFFLYMNLFVASMLILVLGGNLLVTFVGWEGVGACSYWLVAFWFKRESAASAGKKAFIFNRIGDVGFLIAIFLTFDKVHSLDYSVDLRQRRPHRSGQHHRDLPADPPRSGGQVGADPPVPLARRRDGGPDSGLRAHPRRHHGHRGRLPALPDQPAAARLPRRGLVVA